MDALGPERLDAEGSRERRVDPAGEADHDVAEPVLLDVVVHTELERKPHLLEIVDLRHDPGRRRVGLRAGRAELDHARLRGLPVPGERPAADVAQPPADGRDRVDVDHEKLLLEPGGAREHLALVVEHDGVAVEDQLVLAADRVAEREEARVVARTHAQHLFTLPVLADVERRRGDVRDQVSAGQREVGGRRPGLPHVLADRRRDEHVPEAQQHEVAPGREVPVLVEDAVVREVPLAIDAAHLAVREHEARVVQVGVEVRCADERRDAVHGFGDRVDRAPRSTHEAGAEEQVLSRIARHAELGKEDQIRVGAARLLEPVDDPGGVAVDVADDAIDLREC